MEPNDNSKYKFIGHYRCVALDEDHVGDICFQLHRRGTSYHGQIVRSTDLPKQVTLLYTLIK